VPVLDLAPKEKGEPEDVLVEVLPKEVPVEPKEKGDDEGAVWPKVDPPKEDPVVPNFL